MATSYLFQSRAPGTVHVMEFSHAPSPAVLSVTTSDGKTFQQTVSNQSAILTQMDIGQHVNVQFMPTLADLVYVYSFGDRMGEITLQGMAFASGCNGKTNGPESIMNFYNANRAINESRVMKITVGIAATLRGFLTDMRITQSNSEMRTASFTLSLAAMPRRTK